MRDINRFQSVDHGHGDGIGNLLREGAKNGVDRLSELACLQEAAGQHQNARCQRKDSIVLFHIAQVNEGENQPPGRRPIESGRSRYLRKRQMRRRGVAIGKELDRLIEAGGTMKSRNNL